MRECASRDEVYLVIRVDKVLDLCLCELAHAQQTGAWRDLISVRLADLGRSKGQLPAIVIEQVPAKTQGHNAHQNVAE